MKLIGSLARSIGGQFRRETAGHLGAVATSGKATPMQWMRNARDGNSYSWRPGVKSPMHISTAGEHYDGTRCLDDLVQSAARLNGFEVGCPVYFTGWPGSGLRHITCGHGSVMSIARNPAATNFVRLFQEGSG